MVRFFGPWRHWQRAIFAAAVNVVLMSWIKDGLKWVFGRPWPETWIDNNQSLIGDGSPRYCDQEIDVAVIQSSIE
jgi:hypothetical protein